MSFFDRQYEVFAVLGGPKAEAAWSEPRWERIADIFDPIVQKARDRAAVARSIHDGCGEEIAVMATLHVLKDVDRNGREEIQSRRQPEH